MPHVVVEYSANLEEKIDIPRLVRDVHEAMLDSGVFRVGAVRTRAARRDLFVIADGDTAHGFVHVDVRMAAGRSEADRKRVADSLLAVVAAETRDVYARTGMGLSVEVREIDGTAAVRLNNLHDRIAAKGVVAQAD